MTDHSPLERRYRRCLALYPKSFRAEHEDEMVAVLMQGADPDQTRPHAREAADLATHALRRRVEGGRPPSDSKRERLPGDWEHTYANVMFPLCIAIALWLCLLSVFFVGFHHGAMWLIVFVPAIAAHIRLAYRIRPSARSR